MLARTNVEPPPLSNWEMGPVGLLFILPATALRMRFGKVPGRTGDPAEPPADGGRTIIYRDFCYLGRYRGVFDEPRSVPGRAGRVIDPPRVRKRGFCRGAGDGLASPGEEKGKRVSYAREKELAATCADMVGAACPFCNSMFPDALASIGEAPPQLLDITQIAELSLTNPHPDGRGSLSRERVREGAVE